MPSNDRAKLPKKMKETLRGPIEVSTTDDTTVYD